ncbi:MAG: TldD/PmbA family protein [Thermococci archaeon]|nr:TldD/PmbA family protein [Thermococci archaeon]
MIPGILSERNVQAEWEVYVEAGRNGSFQIENEELEKAQRRFYSGVGLRIASGGYVGFSYATGLKHGRRGVEELVRKALALAKLGEVEFHGFPAYSKAPAVAGVYDRRIDEIPFEEAYEMAEELAGYMRDVKPSDEYILSGGVSLAVRTVGVMNSNGVEAVESRTMMKVSGYTVKKGERPGDGYSFQTYRHLVSPEDMEGIVRKSLEDAKKNSEASKMEGYTGEIALHPHALASILSVFLPNLMGDSVYYGRSRISRVGEAVASDALTIRDDARIEGWPGSYSFDGEGAPGQSTVLIERGEVRSFLLDETYARLLGMKSTGNGLRGFRSTPEIGTSNVIIEPGKESCRDPDVPMVVKVFGEHTANPVSGDFSLTVDLGEFRGRYFKDNMLTGNVFDLLRNISVIGRDPERVGNFSSPVVISRARIV